MSEGGARTHAVRETTRKANDTKSLLKRLRKGKLTAENTAEENFHGSKFGNDWNVSERSAHHTSNDFDPEDTPHNTPAYPISHIGEVDAHVSRPVDESSPVEPRKGVPRYDGHQGEFTQSEPNNGADPLVHPQTRTATERQEASTLLGEKARLKKDDRVELETAYAELARERQKSKNLEISMKEALARVDELTQNRADELRALQNKLKEAEQIAATLQDHNDTIEAHLEKARREAENLRTSHQEALETVDLLRGDLGRSMGSDHFTESYTTLRNRIETWAQTSFGGEVHVTEVPNSTLRDLAAEHNEYLEDPDMRPRFVQAFVWWVLVQKVFDHTAKNCSALWWARPCRKELSGLRSLLLPQGKCLLTQ
jgi:hypothetical protein